MLTIEPYHLWNKQMKKAAAIEQFGSIKRLATVMEISTQAISHWPDKLPLGIADRVRGAAVRVGFSVKQIIALDPGAQNQ